MTKLTSWTGKNSNGKQTTIEFHEKNNDIVQVIKKGGRVTHKINYGKSDFQQVFGDMMKVQQKVVNDSNTDTNIIPEDNNLGVNDKINIISDLGSDLDKDSISKVLDRSDSRDEIVTGLKPLMKALNLMPYYYRKDVKVTREEILDDIYDHFGYDWFVVGEFKEIYDKNYDSKVQARKKILRLCNKDLEREEVTDDDRWEDGRINYKYRLTQPVIDTIEEHGGVAKDGIGRWDRKKLLVSP